MPYFTSNGANIFVDVSGEGTPVLLVHGLSLDHRQWDMQREALAPQHRVLRMDLRGHGRSESTEHGHGCTALGEDVRRAMVQVGMDRLDPGFLIGHSLSADAVLQAALAEPRALRGVVVATPAVWGHEWSPEWIELMHAMRKQARAGDIGAALEIFRADVVFEGVRSRPELDAAVRDMQATFSGAYLLSNEGDEGSSTLERLQGCEVPILALRGDRDRADFQIAASEVAEHAPRAHVAECEGVGHFPNLEDPESFNRIVMDFIAENS